VVYAVAFGGLAGTALLAYVLIERRYIHPRWKRVAMGLLGFSLAALLWIIHPLITDAPNDNSSASDEWP
jgi:hypothetical protein